MNASNISEELLYQNSLRLIVQGCIIKIRTLQHLYSVQRKFMWV